MNVRILIVLPNLLFNIKVLKLLLVVSKLYRQDHLLNKVKQFKYCPDSSLPFLSTKSTKIAYCYILLLIVIFHPRKKVHISIKGIFDIFHSSDICMEWKLFPMLTIEGRRSVGDLSLNCRPTRGG